MGNKFTELRICRKASPLPTPLVSCLIPILSFYQYIVTTAALCSHFLYNDSRMFVPSTFYWKTISFSSLPISYSVCSCFHLEQDFQITSISTIISAIWVVRLNNTISLCGDWLSCLMQPTVLKLTARISIPKIAQYPMNSALEIKLGSDSSVTRKVVNIWHNTSRIFSNKFQERASQRLQVKMMNMTVMTQMRKQLSSRCRIFLKMSNLWWNILSAAAAPKNTSEIRRNGIQVEDFSA